VALLDFLPKAAVLLATPLLPSQTDVIHQVMRLARKAVVLVATASLCGCDNAVPSMESVAYEPSVQNVSDIASGDRLICVGAIADGPCTHSNAQAIISGSAEDDYVSVQRDGEQKVIVSIGAGKLEKSSRSAMDGKVTIEYR
jgi:hypothetical protein